MVGCIDESLAVARTMSEKPDFRLLPKTFGNMERKNAQKNFKL